MTSTRRTFLQLAGCAAVGCLAGCLSGAISDSEPPAGGPSAPTLNWQFETDPVFATPAVADGTVYASVLPGSVVALDDETSAREWRYDFRSATVSSPTVTGDSVYANGGFRSVALDRDGTERWTKDLETAPWGAPTVHDETAFVAVPETGASLYALTLDDGTERWTDGASSAYTPAASNGTLYVAGGDSIVALDADAGRERWAYRFDGNGLAHTAPVVADGRVFVGTNDRRIVAVDADDGTETWTAELGAYATQPPVVDDGTLYLGTEPLYPMDSSEGDTGSSLLALDARSGDELWRIDRDAIGTTVAMGEGALYATSFERLVAVDATDGSQYWEYDFNAEIEWQNDYETDPSERTLTSTVVSRPVILEDRLLVGNPSRGVISLGGL